MADAIDIVKLRHIGVREWSVARLVSIQRAGADRVQLEISEGKQCDCFVTGTQVEVHLPLGGCFVAVLESMVPGFLLLLKVVEFLEPNRCMDDLSILRQR